MTVDQNQIRAVLLEQHRRLREVIAAALELADRYRAGEAVATALAATLAELREEFVAHNKSEEAALAPLLGVDDAWGPARIARMMEEHTAEHAIFRQLLSGTTEEMVGSIVEIAEEIAAHMDAEERTFLSPKVLK